MSGRAVILALMATGLVAAPAAWADHDRGRDYDGYDYARVIDVDPIVRYVSVRTPREECWNETVYHDRGYRRNYRGSDHTAAPAMIAGGLIGGLVGRQFGSGSGRDAMTLAGTLIGSSIAHDQAVQSRSRHRYDAPRHESVRRCDIRHEVHEERQVDGYRVTYEYNGRSYTTRMAHDPGDEIQVRVLVEPVYGS